MAKQQLKSGISKPANFGCVKVNCHAVANRLGAGGDRRIPAFNFDKAEPAGSKRRAGSSYGAQIRYIEAVIQSYPENACSLFGLYFNSIYGQCKQLPTPI